MDIYSIHIDDNICASVYGDGHTITVERNGHTVARINLHPNGHIDASAISTDCRNCRTHGGDCHGHGDDYPVVNGYIDG